VGDTITFIEQVVGSTTERMLELVAATSEAIGNAAYAAAPDYLAVDINLPAMGGVNGAISKDPEVFGEFNFIGIVKTRRQLGDSTSNILNPT
jgi:hypothetical protein